jgi:hypothetical protein
VTLEAAVASSGHNRAKLAAATGLEEADSRADGSCAKLWLLVVSIRFGRNSKNYEMLSNLLKNRMKCCQTYSKIR